jgi:hypothetical protein
MYFTPSCTFVKRGFRGDFVLETTVLETTARPAAMPKNRK